MTSQQPHHQAMGSSRIYSLDGPMRVFVAMRIRPRPRSGSPGNDFTHGRLRSTAFPSGVVLNFRNPGWKK